MKERNSTFITYLSQNLVYNKCNVKDNRDVVCICTFILWLVVLHFDFIDTCHQYIITDELLVLLQCVLCPCTSLALRFGTHVYMYIFTCLLLGHAYLTRYIHVYHNSLISLHSFHNERKRTSIIIITLALTFYFNENKPKHFGILKYVSLWLFGFHKQGGRVKFYQTQTSRTCMQQLHNRKLHWSIWSVGRVLVLIGAGNSLLAAPCTTMPCSGSRLRPTRCASPLGKVLQE